MIRAVIIVLCAAVLLTDTADARKRRYYRVVRAAPPPAEPETKRIRTIVIHCSDISTLFDELWCHRVQRPFSLR